MTNNRRLLYFFSSLIFKSTKSCAVVKSNAYGNNFMEFDKEISRLGEDWLIVDSITEGLRLRKEGIKKPVLVLGYTLPEKISEAEKNDIQINLTLVDSQFDNL